MKKILTLTILLAMMGTAFADAQYYSEQYHTVQKVELYEMVTDELGNERKVLVKESKLTSPLDPQLTQRNLKSAQNVGEILMMTKELIAFGKEIYGFIEANKPVVNVESTPVSVLPRDEKGAAVQAFALSNWSAPKTKTYVVEFKNYLGMTPVVFKFMTIYSYGGKHNDKGFYITGAQIKPIDVEVSWGYKLDATFSVQSITNMGSVDDPIAAVVLTIDYRIETVMKSSSHSKSFFINGLGHTQALQ